MCKACIDQPTTVSDSRDRSMHTACLSTSGPPLNESERTPLRLFLDLRASQCDPMLEDVALHLESLRRLHASPARIEFFEALLRVYDNQRLLDGSLGSETELFAIFRDVSTVKRIVDMRDTLKDGIKFFKEKQDMHYVFEKEEARKRLVALGYIDEASVSGDAELILEARREDYMAHHAELQSIVRYEVDDTLIVKIIGRRGNSKKKTPDFLKKAFGDSFVWNYVESKSCALLSTEKSALIVVPPGFNPSGLVAIAAYKERSVYVVGALDLPHGMQCKAVEEVEKLTRNESTCLIVLCDICTLVENKEAVLMRLVSRRCRIVALMRHSVKNLRTVARFLNIGDVLVFNDPTFDIVYVSLGHACNSKCMNAITAHGEQAATGDDAETNSVVWDHASRLPRPVMIVAQSSSEAWSCARFIFRKLLENAPIEVRDCYPKEIQNFLRHRISLNEYVAEGMEFYIVESRLGIRRRCRSLIMKGTGNMCHGEVYRKIAESFSMKTRDVQNVVIVTSRNKVDFYLDTPVLRSNLLDSLHEALNFEIFHGMQTLSECQQWVESTFLSTFFIVDTKAALVNLQRRGFVRYMEGFEPTSKGCIAARHNMRFREIEILYGVGSAVTEYKILELLSKIHSFNCEGDTPIPARAGKLLQFLVVKKDPQEARALKLLAVLFHVCVDLKLAAAKTVLKCYKSIENKCFACLSAPFRNKTSDIKIERSDWKQTETHVALLVLFSVARFSRVHVFVTDVSDKTLLGYQHMRVCKGNVIFKLPRRRFYNVSIVSDEQFWMETKTCVDTVDSTCA